MALVVRLAHVAAIHQSPYFDHPIIDAQTYNQAAREIAAGRGHPDRVFWQPPGYAYFLGALYAFTGHDAVAPRIAQAGLGALSAVLTARVGAAVFGSGVGLAAGYGAAFYSMLFYFDGELLPPTLAIVLQLLGTLLALRALGTRRRREWLLGGFTLGLASVVVATSLALVAVQAVFARRRALWVLLGATLAVAPVTLRNLARGGEPALISSNAGINLYLGNNPEYHRTVGIRPDREWKKLTSEPARAGIHGAMASSDYYVRRVRDYLASDPAGFARLQIEKLYLLLAGNEILRNHSIYPARADSPLLAVLLWKVPGLAFPWGVIAPLALLGLVARGRRAPLLAAQLGAYAAGVVAFFIAARYRVPLVPWMLVFAAEGARWLVAGARGGLRAAAVLGTAAAYALVNLGQGPMPREMNPDAEYSLAVQLADQGRAREAMEFYLAAIRQKPDYAEAWLNAGTIYLHWGRAAEAESAFARAAFLDPEDPDALVNLGNVAQQAGAYERALRLYERALALKPGHRLAIENLETLERRIAVLPGASLAGSEPPPSDLQMEAWRLLHAEHAGDGRILQNLLAGYERRGELDSGVALLQSALERAPGDASLRFSLGRILVKQGDLPGGTRELRRALQDGGVRVRQWITNHPDLARVRDRLLE